VLQIWIRILGYKNWPVINLLVSNSIENRLKLYVNFSVHAVNKFPRPSFSNYFLLQQKVDIKSRTGSGYRFLSIKNGYFNKFSRCAYLFFLNKPFLAFLSNNVSIISWYKIYETFYTRKQISEILDRKICRTHKRDLIVL
jgi:hypothetical protein